MVKNVDPAGLRIVRSAYVMRYALGTQAHMMRTRRLNARLCARLGKVFGAHPHPATITYELSEQARAPHTNGPRDVPRCEALSLLQKTLPYKGG
jgi:hypothetical protein